MTITEFSIKRICMTPGKWRFHWKMVGSSLKIFTCACKEITDYTLKKGLKKYLFLELDEILK